MSAHDGEPERDLDEAPRAASATALDRVRTDRRTHLVALVAAVAIGLVAAWFHWLGLVLGGGAVALVAPSFRRGIGIAIGFGLLVLVVFAVSLGGATWPAIEMAPVVYLVVASAIGLPMLGSLVRGIV
ncbi:hypothetical protein [Halosolutus gelatinilyticus]|uniref:hypothetical protein n=1 Tax=Halosolutus gelatinilyticus TaxID=2931975 RepID=UPI001FF3AD5F|nr:hypothetical protein [Halosolutus gelatinilyticus]